MSAVTAFAPSPVVTSGSGIWRMRADGKPYPGLPAAIAAVHKGHPDRPDLHKLAWALLPRLPGKPRTSANLKEEGACSGLAPLERIILSDPWLGMNTESAVNVLWGETDKPGFRERLALMHEWHMPVQGWTACGGVGGHVGYIIKEPVVTGLPGQEKADRLRQRKLSLVLSYLNTAIDGDRHAGLRGLTKNPFSPRWDVEVGDLTPVTLDELLVPLQAMANALAWKAPKRRFRRDRSEREPSPEGRNCALFDLVRWWAGDGCVKDGAAILDKAVQVNAGFAVPLGHGEVACVARSITRFMVHRYDGRGRHVPTAPAQVRARQAAGRAKLAERQRAQRDEHLLAALERLRGRGAALGQKEIAVEAGVSLSTVKRAWTTLYGMIDNNSSAVPPASGSSATHAHEDAPASPPEAPSPALDAYSDVLALPAPTGSGVSSAVPHPLDGEPAPPAMSVPAWEGRTGARPADRRAVRTSLKALDGLARRVAALVGRADLRAFEEALGALDPDATARREALADPWSAESLARRRRQRSVQRCEEREAVHEAASGAGLRSYRDFVQRQFAALFREREAALLAAGEPPGPKHYPDPIELLAAGERHVLRVKVIRMAHASKVRAEMRVSSRWDDVLQVREHGALHPSRLRTTPDALDIVVPTGRVAADAAARAPAPGGQPPPAWPAGLAMPGFIARRLRPTAS